MLRAEFNAPWEFRMHWSRVIWIAGLLLWLPSLPAAAKEEAPLPGADHFARQVGLRALKAGRPEEAAKHFLRALRDHPHATLLLEDLLEATAKDPDVQAFWLHRYVATIADENGRFKPSKRAQAYLPKKGSVVHTVATSRAKAAADIAKTVARLKGPGVYTQIRAYRRLFDATADASPALQAKYARVFEQALAKAQPSTAAVLKAIEKAAGAARAPGSHALRLKLGRALIGMASQARQKAPGTEDIDAQKLLRLGTKLAESATAALAAEQMAPATVEQLRAMTPAEIDAFNEKHTRIETPGRAISPKGRYEIRTTCGHGSLLTAASIVDGIHGRLATWFGTDPFVGKPGLIVVLPGWDGLEAENAPYWWAQGFQRGSITTIRFALSDAMGMADVLTHELTHRFDGIYHPAGLGWFKEGRAVWTQNAFLSLKDKQLLDFAPSVKHFRKVPAAYGKLHYLRRLLRGKPFDYRDNYPVGHTLFAYLLTWKHKSGRLLYAEALRAYMASLKASPRKPAEHFTTHFADGKDGRPEGLEAFAAAFSTFFEAFRLQEPPNWALRYITAARRSRAKSKMVLDGPTLVRTRNRAAPAFGQDHVRTIAHLLNELGQSRAAIGLLEWSRVFDELDEAGADLLVKLCEALGRPPLIAAARSERQRHSASSPPKEEQAALAALALPSYRTYVAALRTVAEDLHGQGHNKSAQWFLDEHDVLVSLVGGEPLNLPALQGAPADAIPNMGVPVELGRGGWHEAPLEGYNRRRDPGRWFITPEDHLVVGQRKQDTARKEYTEAYRRIFVRDDVWHESRYFFEARIHLIGPYVRGAIVVGCRRADRHLRLEFDAGRRPRPWNPTQKMVQHKGVQLRFEGLREYDDVVERTGSSPSRSQGVTLKEEGSTFSVSLRVRGPRIECWIDDEYIGSYTDPQGMPADGYIGFAASGGAFRVEEARLQRLRARNRSTGGLLPEDHDVESPKLPLGRWVQGYRVRGVEPGREGSLVYWYPLGAAGFKEDDAGEAVAAARADWTAMKQRLKKLHHDGRFVVALPKGWPELSQTLFDGVRGEVLGPEATGILHGESRRPGTPTDPAAWGKEPLLLFVDPLGIVRYIGTSQQAATSDALYNWLRYTRGW